MSIVKLENIQNLIIELRGQKTLVDQDVARIYSVETKRVNEAVKNNSDKFPEDYFLKQQRMSWIFCGRNFRPQNSQKQEQPPVYLLKKACTC
jgi:hypothetical protein